MEPLVDEVNRISVRVKTPVIREPHCEISVVLPLDVGVISGDDGAPDSLSAPNENGFSSLGDTDQEEYLPYPGFAPISLGYFQQTARPRSWCLILITNPWFERVSMMVILLNCVTLGMYQPCQDKVCNTSRCKILQLFDDLIFAFFAIEMVIKITAMGFWGKGTYLAETWNRLDCFIVVAGFAEYCLDVEYMNLSTIRTIRVLRPLRAINRIPSMRILVMLLLDTLPMLGNVLLLCFFVFFIFGIVGVQLWSGLLRQRCVRNLPVNVPEPNPPISSYYQDVELEKDYICSLPKDAGMHRCENLPPTRFNGIICNETGLMATDHSNNDPNVNVTTCINWNQYYTICNSTGSNPFKGAISFDNIGLAWVAIFLVISLEGWTDIMYYVQDAHSFWDWIYFVLLIVIGSFFMINLCLVVIATQFSETKKREMERMRMERARYQSTSTLTSNSMSEPTSCYTEIIKYIAHLWRRAKRKIFVYYKNYRSNREKDVPPRAISLRRKRRRKPKATVALQCGEQTASTSACMFDPENEGSRPTAPRASPELSEIDPVASPRRPVLLKVPSSDGAEHSNGGSSEPDATTGGAKQSSTNNHLAPPRPSPLHTDGRAPHYTCQELLVISGARSAALAATLAAGCNIYSNIAKCETHFSAPQLLFYPLVDPETLHVSHSEAEWSDSDIGYEWEDLQPKPKKRANWLFVIVKAFRNCIKCIVDHKYFQRGILIAILINTLSMGIEYHNQPDYLTVIVETSNVVFSGIFAFEMLLKLIAEGPFDYISNGFNLFDGIIVILSLIELCQNSEGSGLSVLRTFRLLRILKLVRFLPALRRQLFVMLRTMDNVAVFFALLILFIFVFSILGMNLFGCNFCEDKNLPQSCERKNFDSLLWAIVTVFQILTQEDWNVVLFKGMEKTSPWAALYFVALMTFGNYVLFNLLVAILVEGFSSERHEYECEEKHLAMKALEKKKGEERKTSHESLTKGEDCKNESQDLEDKERELEKLKQFDDDNDPKCNIIRETRMLNLPPAVAITKSERSEPKSPDAPCLPPMITHTAATPQGSPNATLEPIMRDLGAHMLSPAAGFNRSAMSLDTIDRSSQSSALSIPSLSNSSNLISRSSNTQLSVHFGGTQTHSPQTTRRGSLSHDSGPLTRKDSLSPSPSRLQRKGSIGGQAGSPLQRRGSRGSICNWRRRSRRRGDQETLVDSDLGSDEDTSGGGEHEESLLNNSNLNNSYSVSPIQERSHCNGGPPIALQNTPHYKRNILTQQNSIGTPVTLSPQNSVRSRPQSPRVAPSQLPTSSTAAWHVPSRQNSIRNSLSRQNSINSNAMANPCALSPQNSASHRPSLVPSRQNSLSGSCKDEFKPNNLDAAFQPSKTQEAAGLDFKDEQGNGKICCFFEIPPQLEDREDHSLFLFSPENPFRKLCVKFTEKKWFDYTVLIFIALNCITLAMERPKIPPDSVERLFLTCANYIFTVVFALEMAVKVAAWGLWYGKHTYFRSGWNIMDGSLVIVSLVDILMSIYSTSSPRIFGILRVFRLLRSLRPLRVINRAPGLKLVVQTLLSSLRPIGNIVLICCTFFIIFGILGVQLFKGTFYFCDGPNVKNVKNKTDCYNLGNAYHWVNRKYNFDDLGQALMSLFVLSSKDGWVNIMYQGLDAVGVDQQPIENYSEWRLLYFISFLLLVGFFVLNMFVGVVVENFHRCREEQEKEEKARRAEKRARKLEKKRRKMRDPPYYINYSRPRLFIHNIVTSKYFDLAIAAVIGLNVVTMAMEFYMMPAELVYALEIFNYFFTAVFVLESAMKMLALGMGRYFQDKWNQLDVAIVILSLVGIILEKMESAVMPINPTIIRVMRVLRIARVLKLLKMAKGIRALLDTVMQALPQVGNLGLLFFLLFFIFAALGVELFGRLECDEGSPCQGLGEHAHFQNFGMAFLTLFRVATGDNWNGIMKDTLREECDEKAECVTNCCVSPIIAPLYFVVFVLMAQFVLVNVVVAVLMKHLEESHKQMEDDFDMEVELERELAAEEEAAAAVAAGVAKAAAIEQNKDRGFAKPIMMYSHKPVFKMSSLPANFTFHSDDPESPPRSPSLLGADMSFEQNATCLTPSVESELHDAILQPSCVVIYNDANNVNIRQASPEEPVNKVTVADLRTISPALLDKASAGPSPAKSAYSCDSNNKDCLSLPGSQWSIDRSFGMFPTLDFGDGVATSLSLTTSTLGPCGDVILVTPEISPDCCHTARTEGSDSYPPPYQSVVVGRSDSTFGRSMEQSGTLEDLHDAVLFDDVQCDEELNVALDGPDAPWVDRESVPLRQDLLGRMDPAVPTAPGDDDLSSSPSNSSSFSSSSSSSSSSGSPSSSSSASSSPSSSHHLLEKEVRPPRLDLQDGRRTSTASSDLRDNDRFSDSSEGPANGKSRDEEDTPSSLDLTGLVGNNSSLVEDSLSGDEWGPNPAAFREAEDVLIVDPAQNKIVCIYDGIKRRQTIPPAGNKVNAGHGEPSAAPGAHHKNGGGSEVNLVPGDLFDFCFETKAATNSPSSPKSSEDGSSALC